jgi:hypothetical protein
MTIGKKDLIGTCNGALSLCCALWIRTYNQQNYPGTAATSFAGIRDPEDCEL